MARRQHSLGDEDETRVTLRMGVNLKRHISRLALDLSMSENALMLEALQRGLLVLEQDREREEGQGQ